MLATERTHTSRCLYSPRYGPQQFCPIRRDRDVEPTGITAGIHRPTYVSSMPRAGLQTWAKLDLRTPGCLSGAVEPPNGACHDAEACVFRCQRRDPGVRRWSRGTRPGTDGRRLPGQRWSVRRSRGGPSTTARQSSKPTLVTSGTLRISDTVTIGTFRHSAACRASASRPPIQTSASRSGCRSRPRGTASSCPPAKVASPDS